MQLHANALTRGTPSLRSLSLSLKVRACLDYASTVEMSLHVVFCMEALFDTLTRTPMHLMLELTDRCGSWAIR